MGGPECTWLIKQPTEKDFNGHITIAFTAMTLDHGAIEFTSSQYNLTITGDYLLPVTATFTADAGDIGVRLLPSLHSDEMGGRLPGVNDGFRAEIYTSTSTEEKCINDCSGNGVCTHGACDCGHDWTGGDCSTPAPLLGQAAIQVNGLQKGEFAYFTLRLEEKQFVQIEFADASNATGEPLLMMGLFAPRLNPATYFAQDTHSWYYDSSDMHVLTKYLPAGTYTVGLTNHDDRPGSDSSAVVRGSIVARTATDHIPCIADCFGHGSCPSDSKGHCVCDAGYTGFHAGTGRRTCEYTSAPLTLDQPTEGSVRVGQWQYYAFQVLPHQAGQRVLTVHLESLTPDAHGVVLVSKAGQDKEYPHLKAGFTPGKGAFEADYMDNEGFSRVRGAAQEVKVPMENVTAGEWHVAVYNIWGYTGMEYSSGATMRFRVMANLHTTSTPCPVASLSTCSGFACARDKGVCECPIDRAGRACQTHAQALPNDMSSTYTLSAGQEAVFFLDPMSRAATAGHNLVVKLHRNHNEDVPPVLIAKQGGEPVLHSGDFHEHALHATDVNPPVYSVLLDRTQLHAEAGTWYVKVAVPAMIAHTMTYSLSVETAEELGCPESNTGELGGGASMECSGNGKCDRSTGRCLCDEGWVLEACNGKGVFTNLTTRSRRRARPVPPGALPSVPIGGWSFWVR
jgi:hypothetical protein